MYTLSISAPDTAADFTLEVARIVARHETSAKLVPNISIVGGDVEAGVDIHVFRDPADGGLWALFTILRTRLGLGCAWLETEGFSGCVLKYLGYRSSP